jgi:cytochrome c peroxidase
MSARKGLSVFFSVVVIVSAAALFSTSLAQGRNGGGGNNGGNGQVAIDFGPVPPPIPDDLLAPLSSVGVPEVPGLNAYISNRAAAIALGKALFWDMQAGSDGVQACATCHFNAGADSRVKNQVNPGSDGIFGIGVKMAGNTYPNYHLYAGTPGAGWGGYHDGDFPLRKLSNVDLNNTVISDTNDIVGSEGAFATNFDKIVLGSGIDQVVTTSSSIFSYPDFSNASNVINVRQVTGRNTPSNINAVYNYRLFWDGRAMNVCNGANPFGDRDPDSHMYSSAGPGNALSPVLVRLQNSALCSQALGPALSPVEMSANGRIFRELGRKLFSVNPLQQVANTTPLGRQFVDPSDSVLGSKSKHPHKGLKTTYEAMVKAAFRPAWWSSPKRVCVAADNTETVHVPGKACKGSDYSQMEYNFSLFWGLSIQMYESTLRADQTPLDQYLAQQKVISINGDGARNGYNVSMAPGVTPYSVSVTLIDTSLELTDQEIYSFDDGQGHLVGIGITAGNIDYATGQMTVIFERPLTSIKPLRIAYSVGQTPMTTPQLRGLQIFETKGRCIACHGGPEMSNASVTHNRKSPIERMLMRDLSVKVYDNGFYNIGVRPPSEDGGLMGNDGVIGAPLSFAEYERQQVCNDPTLIIMVPARIGEGLVEAPLDCYSDEASRLGNFKAPMLRNVALTAPYFHNGGQLTLEQVVEYYDRGGDFTDGLNVIPNIDADIQPLGLSDQDKSDLVDFLRNGLTDNRTVVQSAPFDHPELFLAEGHPSDPVTGYPVQRDPNHPGQATDLPVPMVVVPATGRKGGQPLKTFLENALEQ